MTHEHAVLVQFSLFKHVFFVLFKCMQQCFKCLSNASNRAANCSLSPADKEKMEGSEEVKGKRGKFRVISAGLAMSVSLCQQG